MIIRRRHTANYTTIGNRLFEDERLAADEVGVLAFLLSRPNDWEVRRPALMRRWGIGVVAIKRIVHNWMRTGWCRAEKVRLPNGTFYVAYEIRDEPGPDMTDDEIREALSLVSSEAAADEFRSEEVPDIAPDQPHDTDDPPPCDRGVADQGVVTDRWPIRDSTNNGLPRDESYQKPEREAQRLKEKHALSLAEFKRRWPTNAADDQGRVDRSWFALNFEEGDGALAGIVPFLENLKRLNKKHPPAGWRYLEEKRWTLLADAKAAAQTAQSSHPRGSPQAISIEVLHEIAGREEAFRKIWRRPDGSVGFRKPMTLQLAALAQAPRQTEWVTLDRNQAGAWEGLLRQFFDPGEMRKHLHEGSRAPWPWPPSAEGKIYTTGPPESLMQAEDFSEFK